ncbi:MULTISPECIES: hypothetical protein [Moorena]|uniref:hypothetical protein n=1 Tax=Moorena TaxID=1155738 RepID=UPI00030C99A7|nr:MULTISPECIES: hypothetical protein [Moorena]NEQ13121.1 hypothetical protein [Moorena sp. SIO3E2]NEP32729.1 hypothetical protein [Moorena sp. SIO3B2]NEP65609.1 hypothetical protein [Moorena sp. SIO3A5]NEQ08919.1 hypothetical protein [Moorena sp. SIO4E2]NER86054.1 hypothetical protein [Moorena sp. SIO3A2]
MDVANETSQTTSQKFRDLKLSTPYSLLPTPYSLFPDPLFPLLFDINPSGIVEH